ncbi:MAG: glutathione S-transferase C-terminal domain-containing protein [Cyanobacteria bacterium J06642_2]
MKPTSARSLPPKLSIVAVRGLWQALWHAMMAQLAPTDRGGAYVRPTSQFRNYVSRADGASFPAATGRYRLYVGKSCPWAHRTLLTRALKGLEGAISVTFVSANAAAGGWIFDRPHRGCDTLAQFYRRAQPGYRGRATVPVLWDEHAQAIVNNESAEIIVMLNAEFDEFARHPECNLYPLDLQVDIDHWNERIYNAVNNGVYRCGMAQSQTAYDDACAELFAMLDELDATLATRRYVCGDRITLTDVRLFPTLIRFDAAYYGLFKCNRRRICDYEHLGPYLRDIYQLPGVAATCDLEAIVRDYYGNLFPLNPGGIIPAPPDRSYLFAPHQRESCLTS